MVIKSKTEYGNLVRKCAEKIMSKYRIDSNLAEKYAVEAMNGLESHGGNIYDENSMNEVIDVVVSSWLENRE